MKSEEVRALGPEEVKKQLGEAQRELFNLRFRHATRQLVNNRELVKTKRKIAQLMTIQRERELGIAR